MVQRYVDPAREDTGVLRYPNQASAFVQDQKRKQLEQHYTQSEALHKRTERLLRRMELTVNATQILL